MSGAVLGGHFPPCIIFAGLPRLLWSASPTTTSPPTRKSGRDRCGNHQSSNKRVRSLLDTGTPVADWMRARMKKFARAENLRVSAGGRAGGCSRLDPPPRSAAHLGARSKVRRRRRILFVDGAINSGAVRENGFSGRLSAPQGFPLNLKTEKRSAVMKVGFTFTLFMRQMYFYYGDCLLHLPRCFTSQKIWDLATFL